MPVHLLLSKSPRYSIHLYSYSKRLPWAVESNSFSRLLSHKRREGAPLIDLTVSNPTAALADYPHAQIAQALGGVSDFQYSPDPFGSQTAREAIANSRRPKNAAISPDQLALTASTSEAYSLLFKLLCDAGDEVLVPAPSYPLFEYLALLDSVKVVPYSLLYDGAWFLDFASLQSKISARTRAIIVVNPNNPTGSFLKMCEVNELCQLSAQQRIPIISDEVFTDYAFTKAPEQVRTLVGHHDALIFSLNGLSKSAGMPQLKLGWILIDGPKAERLTARKNMELLLDTYLSVNTPVQRALPDLLTIGDEIQAAILSRITQNKNGLTEALTGTALQPLPTEAGWSAIIQVPNIQSEEQWITKLLLECDTVVQPGYFFDMPSETYLVVSLLTRPDEFAQGIARLKALDATL